MAWHCRKSTAEGWNPRGLVLDNTSPFTGQVAPGSCLAVSSVKGDRWGSYKAHSLLSRIMHDSDFSFGKRGAGGPSLPHSPLIQTIGLWRLG